MVALEQEGNADFLWGVWLKDSFTVLRMDKFSYNRGMNDRQMEMVRIVNEKGWVSFKDLRASFPHVSEMTLRRDLEMLDQGKHLIRIHGGARSIPTLVGTDDVFSKRAVSHVEDKQLIASKALRFFLPGSSVYLDSGSTVTEFAKVIPDEHVLIFTGSLTVALELTRLKNATVNVFGGQLNTKSLTISGSRSIGGLEDINLDCAFLGTTGYSKGRGFTCGNEQEYLLKKSIAEKAEKNIVLMDSSKIDVVSTFTFATLKNIDVVIGDGRIPEKVIEDFQSNGIEVL